MFKKIPGNTEYRINLQQEIVDAFGNKVSLKENSKGLVEIDLFGKKQFISKLRLMLLSWYEVDVIENVSEHLDKIVFYPSNNKTLRVTCGYIMSLKEPVMYKPNFRYIPSHPRFAISLEGVVLDTKTNIVVRSNADDDGYEVAYIYSPDKCKNRNTRVHRLMALAWLPNNDFINRPFINHLDGNRLNNSLENLEWCNQFENMRHASETGLLGTLIGMKSRDVITGEVVYYPSVTDMSSKLGMSNVSASNLTNKLPGYLYQKRYEIKLQSDETPWFYEDVDYVPDEKDPNKAFYTITVLDKKTGNKRKFINTKLFYKAYGLWTKSGRLGDGIVLFKERYPDHDVSYVRNTVQGPYRIFNIKSKQTIIVNSIMEAGNTIGLSRTELQYDLSRRRKFIYCGEWVVLPNKEKYSVEYKDKPKPMKAVLVILEDGTELTFKSMKEAARNIGVDFKSVVKHIDSGKKIKGLEFRALKQ